MSSNIYVKHTDKFYEIEVNTIAIDYIIFKFNSFLKHNEFFDSFHKFGDVNYINGTYFFRHEKDSFRYEILLKLHDKFYILEVMSVDYDWKSTEESKKLMMANVSFLNGDERTEKEFNTRFREIKIDKLLSSR